MVASGMYITVVSVVVPLADVTGRTDVVPTIKLSSVEASPPVVATTINAINKMAATAAQTTVEIFQIMFGFSDDTARGVVAGAAGSSGGRVS